MKRLSFTRTVSHDSNASDQVIQRWKNAAKQILAVSSHHNKNRINSALKAAGTEHMSEVDCFDGAKARASGAGDSVASTQGRANPMEEDDSLIVIAPVVDGRLKDFGRQ